MTESQGGIASSSKTGRVSIICPTTDERVLFHPQLYGCFVAQRWPDKELVVVDTGTYPSPFLSLRALEDERLVYQHHACAMGTTWPVGLKRNMAVQLASGAIIAHFDDDDLYAPCYLDRMVQAMGTADAVTLSSWLVCDPFAGLVGVCEPTDADESWVLGYGFSHCYSREACLAKPFPHVHFAEDYTFMLGLRERSGGRGVRTHRDDEGILLHMQHGANLSNTHAKKEVSPEKLSQMPVAELSGFEGLVHVLQAQRARSARRGQVQRESSFISFGDAYQMYLRGPPFRGRHDMEGALSALGAPCGRLHSAAQAASLPPEDAGALVACRAQRCREIFVEPGRVFSEELRFSNEVNLPGDVDRFCQAERLALLHMARMLLRRCPARPAPERKCSGRVLLTVQALSHIAIASLVAQFVQHFPGIRLEVNFESGPGEDLEKTEQRERLRRMLVQQVYPEAE